VKGTDLAEKRTRHTTGIPGLDIVLHGGLLPGSVYIIRGTPGAGKTITANQICFYWASQNERCLYITLLSESHDRLVENLAATDFFTAEGASRIHYQSGFHTLEEEGLNGVLKMLVEETKRYQTCVVVLDGLFALQEKVGSDREFRLFMNQLQNLAHLTGSTMLLLTNSDRGTGSPEYTMVDGWLEVAVQQRDYRTLRFLQIHKLRGSGFIDGQHALKISDAGVSILPRFESYEGNHRLPTLGRERLSSGWPDLDRTLHGGFRRASTAMLVGPSGIGKTTVGLHFASAASAADPALYFTFYEAKEDLVEKAELLGIENFSKALDSGALEVMWRAATEHQLDEIAYELLAALRARGVKRLVIDSLDALKQTAERPDRVGRFLGSLTNVLRNEDVTTVFTMETPELIGGIARTNFTALSALSQNIVLMRYVEVQSEIKRTLTVIKCRTSGYDSAVQEFTISDQGMKIIGPLPAFDDLLTGHAHPSQARRPNAGDTDD